MNITFYHSAFARIREEYVLVMYLLHEHFEHHLRMKPTHSSVFVGLSEDKIKIHLIYCRTHYSYKMSCRDWFVRSRRKQPGLILFVGPKGDFVTNHILNMELSTSIM